MRTAAKLAGAGILLFLVAEASLRWIPRSWVPSLKLIDRVYQARGGWNRMMAGDGYLGYHLRPGLALDFESEGRTLPIRTVAIQPGGAVGYRDLGTSPPFSMIAIGGSFAACDDVPDEACWVRKLGESKGVSAATLGVNGYSTEAAARLLERHGMSLKPKIVLVEIHPNDFRDNQNFDNWSASGDSDLWAWLGEHHGRTKTVKWLGESFALYRFVDGIQRGYERQLFPYRPTDEIDLLFRFDQWFVTVVTLGANHPGWPSMQKSLRAIRDTAEAGGARVVAILFPTKEQAYWDVVADRAPESVRGRVDTPIDLVAEFSANERIPVCDLREPFRTAALRPEQIYHRISAHMNDAGHRLTASAVGDCLLRLGLLSGGETEHVH